MKQHLISLKEKCGKLKEEFHNISNEMAVMGEFDNLFEPEISKDQNNSIDDIITSSHDLYFLMENYLRERKCPTIMNYRIVSLENEFAEKSGDLICVPNSKEQNSVVSEYLKENMTINYLLHLRYCLLNYISEKSMRKALNVYH